MEILSISGDNHTFLLKCDLTIPLSGLTQYVLTSLLGLHGSMVQYQSLYLKIQYAYGVSYFFRKRVAYFLKIV